jgi:hypothetical protein
VDAAERREGRGRGPQGPEDGAASGAAPAPEEAPPPGLTPLQRHLWAYQRLRTATTLEEVRAARRVLEALRAAALAAALAAAERAAEEPGAGRA